MPAPNHELEEDALKSKQNEPYRVKTKSQVKNLSSSPINEDMRHTCIYVDKSVYGVGLAEVKRAETE